MSLIVQSLESPCVTWKTILPHVGKSIQSPTFTLKGEEACFYIFSTWKAVESWEVRFKSMIKTPSFSKMCVVSYAQKNDDIRYLGCEVAENKYWGSYPVFSILNFNRTDMPDDEVSLVLVFHLPSIPKDDIIKGTRFITNPKQTELEKLPNYSCLTSLSADIGKLFDKEEHSDVVLKCGGRSFLAIKEILSARSEVFATMFKSEMSEKRTNTVDIVDMEPYILEQFLRYIYCGRLETLWMGSVFELYRAGDKYEIPSLKRRCASFMADNLSEDNVCKILSWADTFKDTELSEKAVHFAVSKEGLLGSSKWCVFAELHPTIAVKVFVKHFRPK